MLCKSQDILQLMEIVKFLIPKENCTTWTMLRFEFLIKILINLEQRGKQISKDQEVMFIWVVLSNLVCLQDWEKC